MNPLMQQLENKKEKMEAAKNRQKQEGGGVVTRFGNYYSPEEWETLQAGFEKEQQEAAGFIAKMNLLKRQAMEMVTGTGLFSAEQLPKLRAILEDPSRAQFSTEEKRAVVEAAAKWFNEQMRGI